MYIVLHCGGLPFNGDTIKTKSLGGSESAAYYMARALKDVGHHVILFTNSQETGTFDGVKYEWAGTINENHPLGERFSFYAENTPHDVCIIQRHPQAFARKLASKQNLLWLHDLALYRSKDVMIGQMWNVDKVLCVSEYHKNQVNKVYGIPLDRIVVVNNAVDHSLYDCEPVTLDPHKRHLIYSSRPERGLIELVKPGGIMERLQGEAIHLHVCGYENTTAQMKDFYEYLWARCKELPNVTNHGALTKQELAALQKGCTAWVYPTTFEEVSCITAMEAMCAGLPAIVSAVAALPETCKDSGTTLIELREGVPNFDTFCAAINEDDSSVWESAKAAQIEAANKFTWANSAGQLLECVRKTFADAANPTSLGNHFIRHSDIKPFESLHLQHGESAFTTNLLDEYREGYAFYRDNTYAKHYADYYQYEKDRGVNYGPEDVSGTSRFQAVANIVSELPAGACVLDYGCAHGHYTVALATRFPALTFIGADLAQSNVEIARKWAADAKLTNVKFIQVEDPMFVMREITEVDLVIAAEVIEHVGNPQDYVDLLSSLLTKDGRMVITTPYGPWEAQGYRQHGYWRAHLHHFERSDIIEAFGHHPEFRIMAAPSGQSMFSSPLGSYIYTFAKPTEPSREINVLRKTMQTMPDQTVSCCMIVKNAESDIQRCLNSVMPHVQEMVIGVDKTTNDQTRLIIAEMSVRNPLVAFNVFEIASPIETGFDEARNTTINKASCDWVLWIDSDEVMVNGGAIAQFTRNSMYNGFAIRQHHMSHAPVAIIKMDLPCRLFRNRIGIKFFGKVHEHPELKMNDGLGPVMLLPSVEIVHHGYHDEDVRRKRFSRNLPLLARDRKENPDRILGKFLWLRDLAQSCQYEIEAGRLNKGAVHARAEEGIKLWLDLLDSKNYRLVLDALPYYSTLVMLRGGGIDFSFAVNASWAGEAKLSGVPQVEGHFADKAHALALMNALAADKLPEIERRYL